MRHIDRKYVVLLTVFVAALGILNVISAKLTDLPVWPTVVGAGIICYWITFPITDVVAEVYGRSNAQLMVWMGFLTNLLVLLLSTWAVALPPDATYPHQAAFATVLGAVPVIILASLCAYLAAQSHDVWAYHFWKRVTGGRHMWLRNNLSTISSQLIDSILFNGIAFYLFGSWDLKTLVSATVGYWLLKLCIALADTPLVYLLHFWLTGYWSPQAHEEALASGLAHRSPEALATPP
ncbi:MAG: queuosine precursor transporter [Pseudomonadota bacterium]